LGVLVIGLGIRVLPADRELDAPRHFDVTGAVLVTMGLASLTYGIVRTTAVGWGSADALVPIGAAIVLLGSFVVVERRVARAPLVPLSIFRIPQLLAANLIVVLMYFALFSTFFFVTLYLQRVLGQDPLQAGVSFLPMTLSVFTGSSLAPRLVDRFGVRAVATLGMLLATTGLVLLTDLRPSGSYFTLVLPGAVLTGLGMGLALVSSTVAATQGVPAAQSGLASGLLNMSRLFGGALGLAVLSTIASGATQRSPGVSLDQAVTNGFSVALLVGAAVTTIGALLALSLLRRSRGTTVASIAAEDQTSQPEVMAA
jgi:predicted MFS family arabinose efflux permease